jgi:Tol biopolymer transport system component
MLRAAIGTGAVLALAAWASADTAGPRKLAYLVTGRDGTSRRVVMTESGATRTIVPSMSISYVDWSADGKRLALIRPIGETRQVVEIRDLRGERRLLLSAKNAATFYGVAWSPDARSIALLTHDEQDRGAIEIVDVRTLARRVLTRIGMLGPIDWSPKGDLIVVETTRPHPLSRLALVDVVTRHVAPVSGPSGRSASFSPDGERLAFSAQKGIVVLEIATGRLRQVTRGGWQDNEPAWSPDGTMLVYSHAFGHCFTSEPGPPCNLELFAVPAAGGKSVNVTRTPKQQESTPTWLG